MITTPKGLTLAEAITQQLQRAAPATPRPTPMPAGGLIPAIPRIPSPSTPSAAAAFGEYLDSVDQRNTLLHAIVAGAGEELPGTPQGGAGEGAGAGVDPARLWTQLGPFVPRTLRAELLASVPTLGCARCCA